MEQTNTNGKANRRFDTRNLVIMGMFTALLCVMAQISIPTQPIPFTLSLFAIFLTGALLPPRYAFLSVLSYVLLGTFGLPVFADYKGGPQIITGMTGGFIVAYPIMAFVTALANRYRKNLRTVALSFGMLLSLVICYLLGSFWFTVVSGKSFSFALSVCVYPFILFDCIKIALAVFVSHMIRATVFRIYSF